jgi:uncharacterized protein with HEPN domain
LASISSRKLLWYENPDFRDYLQDILDAIGDIESFVGKMTYEEFIKDKKTLNAIVRSIEIIGEASKISLKK